LAGEKEQFDIVRGDGGTLNHRGVVAINAHTLKQIVCCTAGERLETALRVVDAGNGDQTNQKVEDPAHDVPMQRLAKTTRAKSFTGANHHIIACCKERKELLPLFDRRRQISIAQQNIRATRIERPCAHGKPFAAMIAFEDAHTGVALGENCSLICAPIINDQDFGFE
jgi:hypothetical protein